MLPKIMVQQHIHPPYGVITFYNRLWKCRESLSLESDKDKLSYPNDWMVSEQTSLVAPHKSEFATSHPLPLLTL